MDVDSLIHAIDAMASDFVLLERGAVDVPTAGRLLNQLEIISGGSLEMDAEPLRRLSGGLVALLENVIMNGGGGEADFNALQKGITLMQEFGSGLTEADVPPEKDVGELMSEIAELASDGSSGEPPSAAKEQEDDGASGLQDESLLRDFIVEGLEYINEIEVNILNLEQNPEDKDCVNAVFRPFHSIKGVAGFLNLDDIRELAHRLEDLLDKIRKDELSVNTDVIDVILEGADALKALIASLQKKLDGYSAEEAEVDLGALAARIEDAEEGNHAEKGVKRLGDILVEDGVITREALTECLEVAKETPAKKIGETLIAKGKATPKQVSQALRKQSNQASEAASIRVDTSKLDDLIDMVGELVITQTMIRQNPVIRVTADEKMLRDISQLGSIISELQRTSTSLRMIPIKQTFQKITRLVRDLSKATGKKVNVAMTGEETEIDRNMVEEIYNPLVHMVRNAVDHGIEEPAERIMLGKPEAGTVSLKAYHRGGTIVIEIADDGRGLDAQKIFDKAVAHGLIEAGAGLTEQDIFRLIFLPGLSTASAVTDVSGRGVGMDVVKRAIDKLRGKVDIRSVKEKGTTFIASFPLTMAIIDGMIVRVGKEKYIVPTSAVRLLLRPDRSECSTVAQKGEMVNVRGTLIPLIRLHELFGIDGERKKPWESIVMVVDSGNRSKCVMVDEILGKEEVVIKGLGDGMKKAKGVSSGAILGDGNIGLILDPEGLFDLSETAVGAKRH